MTDRSCIVDVSFLNARKTGEQCHTPLRIFTFFVLKAWFGFGSFSSAFLTADMGASAKERLQEALDHVICI